MKIDYEQPPKVSSLQNKDCLSPFYGLEKNLGFLQTSLFKLMKYDQQHLMFSAPDAKSIVVINSNTLQVNPTNIIKYEDKPLAIDIVQLGSGKFIIAGGHNGAIYAKAVKDSFNVKNQLSMNVISKWELKPQYSDQIFVNQITHSSSNPNIVVNCYNNGNIAVWGLMRSKLLHTFEAIHENYTYKIRFQTDNILASCGHDCTAIRTDFQRLQPVSVFSHPLPVWCAYPVDENLIATGGLFGRILIWDARSDKIAQVCNNDGAQTSFITARNRSQMSLFYGDGNRLKKWDIRKPKSQLVSSHQMFVSAEAMLFSGDSLYVCGRGKDLCKLRGCESFQESQQLQIENTGLKILLFSDQQHSFSDMSDGNIDDDDDDEDDEQQMQEAQSQSVQNDQNQQLLQKVQKQKKQMRIDVQTLAKLEPNTLKKYLTSQNYWLRRNRETETQSYFQQFQKEIQMKKMYQQAPISPKIEKRKSQSSQMVEENSDQN